MSRPRVVLVTPTVPYADPPHAGGRYLHAVAEVWRSAADLTVLAPGTDANRRDADRPGAPADLRLLGFRRGRRRAERVRNRAVLAAERTLRPLDPGLPTLPTLPDLLAPKTRALLAAADVIDLQWQQSIRLAPLLRRLHPEARLVGTFHDVLSQSFAREPRVSLRAAAYWRLVEHAARRHERRAVRRLDDVLVFSAKDAALLGDPPSALVVRPPLARGDEPRHRPEPGRAPTALVVSYLARDENDQAARRLLAHLWPRIRDRVPGARLRLVGDGASAAVRDLAAADASVTLAGYVADLAAEYAAADLALVPLWQGAGVKFKTVEALLHGVPVVTTSVGAEGIAEDGTAAIFAAEVADPATLVAAAAAVLVDPAAHQDAADRAQDWARSVYSAAAFERTLLSLLRPRAADRDR